MADNKVFLNDQDVIEIQVVGDQNYASVELMGREIDVKLTQLRGLGKPCLLLDDIRQMGKVEPKGRDLVVELARQLNYDRAAMVGSSGVLKLSANLMLRATGKGSKIRYFDDYDKAAKWLQEFKNHSEKTS